MNETNLESAAPRLTRRHPARAADASEEASGSWLARARVRGRGRVLSRVRVARLTSWSRRTRARPSRRGARRAPTWRRARCLLAVVDPQGCPRGDGKCGPARRPSARARAARARRSPPRPPRDADPREARGCARWEVRPRAPRRVRRARVERTFARQRPTRGVFAREAPSARSAGGPARETDAPRRSIDRDLYGRCGRGRGGVGSETPAASRALPGAAPTAGLPRLRPRLASPRRAARARSLARVPDPFLGSRLSREASRSSRRCGSSSVPTSKGLESTR
jgi:hypothetical protein